MRVRGGQLLVFMCVTATFATAVLAQTTQRTGLAAAPLLPELRFRLLGTALVDESTMVIVYDDYAQIRVRLVELSRLSRRQVPERPVDLYSVEVNSGLSASSVEVAGSVERRSATVKLLAAGKDVMASYRYASPDSANPWIRFGAAHPAVLAQERDILTSDLLTDERAFPFPRLRTADSPLGMPDRATLWCPGNWVIQMGSDGSAKVGNRDAPELWATLPRGSAPFTRWIRELRVRPDERFDEAMHSRIYERKDFHAPRDTYAMHLTWFTEQEAWDVPVKRAPVNELLRELIGIARGEKLDQRLVKRPPFVEGE